MGLLTFRTKDGITYRRDYNGVIHQLDPKPFSYDKSYVSTYDTPAYRKGTEILQTARLAFILGAFGLGEPSIVDVGYGNGDFLKTAKAYGCKVYGSDISGVNLEGIETGDEYPIAEVYTFHDCLEHIPCLEDTIDSIGTDNVVVSLPFCHFNDIADEESINDAIDWFDNWKHRKPDEHLHHFNGYALQEFMKGRGFRQVAYGGHEDIVRRPVDDRVNILTCAFQRIK